jgi:glycosyltransferase involved in cell wall biosynthesis
MTFIQQSEVILLPSFAEAFPMTWLEAMALEKKVVTSDIGWAKELMLHEQTGFMVNPTNTDEFAANVLALLNNEEKASVMAKEARNRIINDFDMKEAIQKNVNLYKTLL